MELIDACTAQLKRFAADAVELLGDKPVEVALRMPCPSCGKKFVYRLSNGENVQSWALRVGEAGARCLGCNATWGTDRLEFLATLLNCPPLPGKLIVVQWHGFRITVGSGVVAHPRSVLQQPFAHFLQRRIARSLQHHVAGQRARWRRSHNAPYDACKLLTRFRHVVAGVFMIAVLVPSFP